MPSDRSTPPRAAYPQERESHIPLRDGSTVHVRPVRSDDDTAIRGFLEAVSPESIAFRFFGTPSLDWIASWSLDVDYADRFALVAETGSPGRIVAHAAYIRIDAERAEVAFLVADAWQGKGISTIMLAQLAEIAQLHGISTFSAEVLAANHRMIDVFRGSGFPVDLRSEPDAIAIELPTSLSPEAIERFEERGRLAAVAAVRTVLEPRSVAVIGASRRRGTIGGEILHNLLAAEFNGPIYAVNVNADVVQSLPAYRSVADLPGPVDLGVIVLRAELVMQAARDCAAAGIRALIVISAGFAEVGEEGERRQQELVQICRDAGMRIVGPNCLGALNTNPAVRLNATFAPRQAQPGGIGFLSQSGGLGIAIIEAAGRLKMGLSSFVAVGNKADLSGNDFLQYWEQDSATQLVLLYLESFGNPRRFARVAPRVSARKPIVAVKSGRSAAGARATSSHTGAMLAGSDVTVDALFEQAGVIRTDTMHELFDVGTMLCAQPVPRGGRIAIVTNAGGPGILCADACQARGMAIEELPMEVRRRLAELLPVGASTANPVDMIASASAEHYRRTLEILVESDACDAIIVIFVPPLVTQAEDVAAAISDVGKSAPDTTFAAVFMTSQGIPSRLREGNRSVPGYGFPEDAARAVAHAVRHGRWRRRNAGRIVEPAGTRQAQAAAIISEELRADRGWLEPARVAELLGCYGLPLASMRVASDADAAIAVASEIGGPVALKAIAPGLLHKSDAGGVVLGLDGPEAVRAGAVQIEAAVARSGHRLEGLLVQPMAPAGVELIVGVVHDHSFGPVLACGAGGTTAELIKDVAVRITPVSDIDARQMVHSLKTFPLLQGYRGAPYADIEAIEDVLHRVSAMVEAHPEIAELDCNPLIAGPDGAVIVDARLRVESAPAAAPISSLRA
jgi:acetyl coenzyme A synthetase (ADP forming)-like protein